MQVTAKLNNLRMSPRKVRLVANLIKGLTAQEAKDQLRFLPKKAALPISRLLDSAVANAKHNFKLDENNLYVCQILVNGGPSLKRWLPRAMGRATPILKRTSNISLILDERVATKKTVRMKKPTKAAEKETETKPLIEKEERIFAVPEHESETKQRTKAIPRPYDSSAQAKKRIFSRQTFGNIRKVFRRKSV